MEGALLILGGPGSGKTEVLLHRLLLLHEVKGSKEGSLLFLTFPAQQALSLRKSLEKALPSSHAEVLITTFADLALMVLKESAPASPELKLLSPLKTWLLVRQAMAKLSSVLKSDFMSFEDDGALSREIMKWIEGMKYSLIRPSGLQGAMASFVSRGLRVSDLLRIYQRFEELLQEGHYLTHHDAVMEAVTLLEGQPSLRERWQRQFSHILVDELQETTLTQFKLLLLLTGSRPSLSAAGHPDLSLYRFQGGLQENLMVNFLSAFKPHVVELTTSYRFPEPIGLALESLTERPEKSLFVAYRLQEAQPEGKTMRLLCFKERAEEAQTVARLIKEMVVGGPYSYGDCVILFRRLVGEAKIVEEALRYYHVPYRVAGSMSLFEDPVVAYLLFYLKALTNPFHDEFMARALAPPFCCVSPTQRSWLMSPRKRRRKASLFSLLKRLSQDALVLPLGLREGLENWEPLKQWATRFLSHLALLREEPEGISGLISAVITEVILSALSKGLTHSSAEAEAIVKKANLSQFLHISRDYEAVARRGGKGLSLLSSFLKEVEKGIAPFMEGSFSASCEGDNFVRLMTFHQAKGLQFPVVFIVGMDEERMPMRHPEACLLEEADRDALQQAFQDYLSSGPFKAHEGLVFPMPFLEGQEGHSHEERRLLFSAMSRAREQVVFTFSEMGEEEVKGPSPFLLDMMEGKGFLELEPGPRSWPLEFEKALSDHELELCLREHLKIHSLSEAEWSELVPFLEEMGLDVAFIGEALPFFREPPQKVDVFGRAFSASQLRDFLACPRRYFYQHVLRVKTPEDARMLLGRLLHDCLRLFHRLQRSFEAVSEEEMWHLLEKVFYKKWLGPNTRDDLREEVVERRRQRGYAHLVENHWEREGLQRRALDFLRRYLKTEMASLRGTREVAHREKQFSFELEGIRMKGAIDRIDSLGRAHYGLVEYKSGRHEVKKRPLSRRRQLLEPFINLEGKEKWRPRDFQLLLYYLGFKSLFGFPPAFFTYYYLGTGAHESSELFARSVLLFHQAPEGEEPCVSQEEIEEAESNLKETLSELLKGQFSPEPQGYDACERCSYGFLCDKETD